MIMNKLHQVKRCEHVFFPKTELMATQSSIGRTGRAAAIEKLFAAISGREDGLRTVLAATALFDTFYS